MAYMLNSEGVQIPVNVIPGFNANYLNPSGSNPDYQSYTTTLKQALPDTFQSSVVSDIFTLAYRTITEDCLFSGGTFNSSSDWVGIGLVRFSSQTNASFVYGLPVARYAALFTVKFDNRIAFVFDPSASNFKLTVLRRGKNPAGAYNDFSGITGLHDEILGHVNIYQLVTDNDPYNNLPTGGDETIPGGGAVTEPGLPGISAASTGIIGLFCPTVAQMQQLSDFMWTDFGGQGTTVIEVLEEIVEAIKRAISNPLDYIFGLNIIPSQGLSIGGSKVVKFGFVSSGVSMPVLSDHYFIVDCGSVSFDVLCGDSFLDYAPYSKFSIYLPYIGFKDIDPNDCVGHTISVKYHGDAITGGLTAYIFKDGNVMYQYSGGCALNVPLSADNWGATIASAASIATGVVTAAATGGAAGVGLAAAKGAASVAANPSLLSPQVMHSGAVSGAPGFMGVQYPFIIREAVNFHSTANFNKESGYPAYYYKPLSEVTGFTTVLDPHINNIPQATQGEMAEIISLLESGVIL